MLQLVVTDASGTGTQAKVPGYTVAGKTGTTPKLLDGVYNGAQAGYMSSFVGFLPASNPRAVILVLVDLPASDTSYYGGDVAAPAFREVAASAMQALGVTPDDPASASAG